MSAISVLFFLLLMPGFASSDENECQQNDPYCSPGEESYYGKAMEDNPDRTPITEEEYKASEGSRPKTIDPNELKTIEDIPNVDATDPQTRDQQREERKNYLEGLTSGQKKGGFNSSYMITQAVKAFPKCLNYCIEDIQMRYDFDPFLDIIFTPYVEHNNADLLVQVYPRISKSDNGFLGALPISDKHSRAPWKEWAKVMNDAVHEGTNPFVKGLYGLRSDEGLGGGVSEGKEYGAHQSLNFKEADVVNNPFLLLPMLLDKSGKLKDKNVEEGDYEHCKMQGCLEERDDAIGAAAREEIKDRENNGIAEDEGWPTTGELYDDAKESVKDTLNEYRGEAIEYKEKLNECKKNPKSGVRNCANELSFFMDLAGVGKGFQRVFGLYVTAMEIIDSIKQANEIMDMFKGISKLLTGQVVSVSVRIDRVLCPSTAPGGGQLMPFMPQYISGLDFFFWRGGLPWTDPHKAVSILNPLSKDRIGVDHEIWGHLYPRIGFVDHTHDAKRGVVNALRAMNIVQENKRTRMRLLEKGFGEPPSHEEKEELEDKATANKKIIDDNNAEIARLQDEISLNGDPEGLLAERIAQLTDENSKLANETKINRQGAWQMIYPKSADECIASPDADESKKAMGSFMYPGTEQRYAFNYWRGHGCALTEKGSKIVQWSIPLPKEVRCPFSDK
ncbi:MAG: hypothetical protein DSZ28_06675 [Thiothrix sp.]|nr:MAG: hypothetical protein DSZ28_06675 [Thiothrix sp.]